MHGMYAGIRYGGMRIEQQQVIQEIKLYDNFFKPENPPARVRKALPARVKRVLKARAQGNLPARVQKAHQTKNPEARPGRAKEVPPVKALAQHPAAKQIKCISESVCL